MQSYVQGDVTYVVKASIVMRGRLVVQFELYRGGVRIGSEIRTFDGDPSGPGVPALPLQQAA